MVSTHTLLFILLFSLWYLRFSLRKTARQQLDIYDLFMLSTVAIIPLFFALFPETAIALTKITGVAFPFVILFGALLAILFVFMNRMIIKLHKLENDNRALIQEVSILKEKIKQL